MHIVFVINFRSYGNDGGVRRGALNGSSVFIYSETRVDNSSNVQIVVSHVLLPMLRLCVVVSICSSSKCLLMLVNLLRPNS